MDVEAIVGADAVLERAGGLILADEARHNLALGILSTARAHPALYPEVEGWVVRDGDSVVGAAVRTPPHNLVLVRPTDDRALFALAEAIEERAAGGRRRDPRGRSLRRRLAAQRDVAFATGSSRVSTRSAR